LTDPVTLSAGYFDTMYASAADPWGFEERWYERRKCAISLAQLPAVRYRRAFEPGCSVGVLTQMLAQRCDALLACDVAGAAVGATARRTQELPHVRVEQRDIAGQWPSGRFDLIVLSEVLYYFGDHDLEQVLKNAVAALEPDGTLLAVHWRHLVTDYPRSGPAAIWLATTDADTVVPPGWLRRQLSYAGRGWDVVLGTVEVADWAEHLPQASDLTVQTSGRRQARAPRGFSHLLRTLAPLPNAPAESLSGRSGGSARMWVTRWPRSAERPRPVRTARLSRYWSGRAVSSRVSRAA
jgi:SAM-dependent methyltransferase